MKKVLSVLLVITFAFSVSAVPLHEKIPEKAKIEKAISQQEVVLNVSSDFGKLDVILVSTEKNDSPIKEKSVYNIKKNDTDEYKIDVSRKEKIPIIS